MTAKAGKIREANHGKQVSMAVLILLAWALFPGFSYAACTKRPLTEGEQSFYSTATSVFEAALPAQEGWRRRTQWFPVPKKRCKETAAKPIRYGGQFKFVEITEADRIREEMALRQKELENKVLDAIKRGDLAEVDRLRTEMQKVVSENVESMRKLQEAAHKGRKPRQVIAKFRINEPRRVVGKKFEIATMQYTAKSFETIAQKGSEREKISRKLYIGPWRVESFKKNWNLFRPEAAAVDAIGSFRLEISGKRNDVEGFLANVIDLTSLEAATR